jgi:DNA invertase Pin-like site-specific DNA recombinase
MLGVFTEFETSIRRERQLEGIAKAKAAGVYGEIATVHLFGHQSQRVCGDSGAADRPYIILMYKDGKVEGSFDSVACDQPE